MITPLADCQIQIWSLPIDKNIHTTFSESEIRTLLSPTELKRYGKFKVDGKRDEFLASRVLLRHLLRQHTECEPLNVEAVPDQLGRPFWFENGRKIPLYFSLSHTRGMVCCAISKIMEIGCDVELVQPRKYEKELAARVFTKDEKSSYDDLRGDNQRGYFYKSWTLKESYVKAVGQGLRIPFTSLSFTKAVELNRLIPVDTPQQGEPSRPNDMWTFLVVSPAPQYLLSCATRISHPEICVFHVKLEGQLVKQISNQNFLPQKQS